MTEPERDPYTGHMTTGHEWNGIKELNTRVPRLVFVFLGAAILFAIGYWVLMPAWPFGGTHTKGLLAYDDRVVVTETLKSAALERSVWTKRVEAKDYAAILADAQLMVEVRQTGHTLYGDNCAACHGVDAKGGKGFPDLRNASSTLWGRDADAIAETIRVGVNSTHPESRASMMPSFGLDNILKPEEIESVVAYVRTLSRAAPAGESPPAKIAAGKAVFADNCAACHGDDATGNPLAGAPNLTDAFWIYGADAPTLIATVGGGRQGHMPTWEARLSALQRKILTLYVADLLAARR